MKAIILAGGHATRLWPITRQRAKPLLPLGDKPIIDYIVSDLEDAEEVIISTNEKFADDFRRYAEEYDRMNVRVEVENQGSEEEKPGTIGAIINLLDQEEIDDDLMIIGGDNYYSFDITDFIDFCEEREGPANVVYEIKNEEMAKNFGIVDTDKDRIVGFEEKPEEPPSTLASTACYYFPEDQVSLFHEYEDHFKQTDVPAEKYLDEPGRLIEWAYERTDMYAFSFDGHWFDIGTPEGYLEANKEITGKKVAESAELEDSKVGENVFVMEGCKIVDSRLENCIVFPLTEVEDSQLKDSIIDSECDIQNIDLNGAVIGKHTTL